MKTFIYYNKFDSTKEPQGRIIADTLEEAVEKAALIKQLWEDEFLQIFEIKEI